MRKLLIACSALTAMMVTGCAPSPAEQCKMGIAATCDKMFECYDDATKTAMASIIGANAAECKTKMEASSDCANKKTDADLCTGDNAGKKYNLGNASACLDKTKALSCADFKDATKHPAECAKMCE